MRLDVEWLGQVDYAAAWARQKTLVAERLADPLLGGKLLLLEHPPTYTLGRNGRLQNLLLHEAALAARGIAFHHVDRGGDITYHGPGQLVGYPILPLKQLYAQVGLGVARRYVHDLETMLMRALRPFGIVAQRLKQHRGVWVAAGARLSKIAAIGVRLQKGGIASHGFALNVCPDLAHFEHIVPCGIQEHGVTSMVQVAKRPLSCQAVLPHIVTAFAEVFPVKTHGDLPEPQGALQMFE